MFKKSVIALLTATTIFSGISAYNSTRSAAEPVKAESRQNSASETRKLDYSQEQDYLSVPYHEETARNSFRNC